MVVGTAGMGNQVIHKLRVARIFKVHVIESRSGASGVPTLPNPPCRVLISRAQKQAQVPVTCVVFFLLLARCLRSLELLV